LVEELTRVARDGFGSPITREDVEYHVMVADAIHLMEEVCRAENKPDRIIGFSSYGFLNIKGKDLLYLHGIALESALQGNGLFAKSLLAMAACQGLETIAMRTQSPVVYKAAKSLCSDFFPQDYVRTPSKIRALGEEIGLGFLKMKHFDSATFVDRGTYGKRLYGSIPFCKEHRPFFNDVMKIDYNAGDSVLVIGKLDRKMLKEGRAADASTPTFPQVDYCMFNGCKVKPGFSHEGY
jgi:hypothetical protein